MTCEVSARESFLYNVTAPLFPALEESSSAEPFSWAFITKWETGFRGRDFNYWALSTAMQSPWAAYIAGAVYLAIVWALPKYMARREAFDLKVPLKYWNLFLAVFSIIGVTRVVPYLFQVVRNRGFMNTLCTPPVYNLGGNAGGFWLVLFVFSKFVELVDTLFIVLRKKHLSFLHWYHHFTVLVYTWDAFATQQGVGTYYSAMNYIVHSVMYFYYYLAAVSKPPKWGVFVTVIQIVQMLAGVALTAICLYLSFGYNYAIAWTKEMAVDATGHGICFINRRNMMKACMMYSTYFYLFAEFFLRRYLKKQDITPKKKA